ncbi:hypothetical protein AB0O07_15485 [Streptomyces sp. NPDC093085]|uniref:hypothetical protein n=1 Tax=Streptomyces sp. NPDC093085 TaxID=3155068 RepID=UPI003449DC15
MTRLSTGDEDGGAPPATRGWVGRLAVVGGFLLGAMVWAKGARPGVIGAFEGERDLSLVYLELPLLLFGMPALARAGWGQLTGALRLRAWVAAPLLLGALALAAWGALAWLDMRTAPFTERW